MTPAALASLLLLICGLAACARSGRSPLVATAIFIEALASLLLLIGYAAADYFTGEGINTAVWYHVRYGLGGAGFGDYRTLIILAAAALVAAPLILLAVVRWRRDRPRRILLLGGGQLCLLTALLINPAVRDLQAVLRSRSPATADFYRHYQPASLNAISDDHPSFIYIFAESLERTYFDEQRFPGLITQLRDLEGKGTTFTNIHSPEGTGFTMGGMVASLCGLPLFTPAHANSMSGMDAFLPGAIGMTDLLHNRGYFLSFIGGASLDFAGKRKFLTTHHFDETAGFQELHGRTQDRTYISNWGLYDDTMFDFAYDRLIELSREPRPFGLFLLTLDTHNPEGHVSKSVTVGNYGDGSNAMLNAVKASDELIARFVRRVRASPAGKNVVIVVASDHLAMQNAASDLLNRGERRNLFMILDPRHAQGAQVDRVGSTLDTGATVLRTLGFKAQMNLGRDLLDATVPDSERLHIQNTDTLLSWRPEVIRFWDFPRLNYSFSVDPESAMVKIDGREFRAPVLVELAKDGRTTLRFQFDAEYDPHLAEQAGKLAPGTRYLLVAKTEDARELLPDQALRGEASWVLVAGRAGQGRTAIPLKSRRTFSKQRVDELLTANAPAPGATTQPSE